MNLKEEIKTLDLHARIGCSRIVGSIVLNLEGPYWHSLKRGNSCSEVIVKMEYGNGSKLESIQSVRLANLMQEGCFQGVDLRWNTL